MLKYECPIDIGNAAVVTNNIAIENIFVMEKLEEFFDFFSEEPVAIKVKEKINSENEEYICILRIRIWNQMGKSSSWSIYSRDREVSDKLIIRRVVWDIDADETWVRSNIKENRELILKKWPSIEIRNVYLQASQNYTIIHLINNLDLEIENGFVLHHNENPAWEWRDLEMLRLYNWGQIHFTWCASKKNEVVEKKIRELISGLDFSIRKDNEQIYQMNFYYSVDPEEYKLQLEAKRSAEKF